jgi:hypothetical protein
MEEKEALLKFISEFDFSHFVKATLSVPKIEAIKTILIKKTIVKKQEHIQFVYRYPTKDITKNYDFKSFKIELERILTHKEFEIGNFFFETKDVILKWKKGVWLLKNVKASMKKPETISHDHIKNRFVEEQADYLKLLGITNHEGQIFAASQDKFKQIHRFVEILSPIFEKWSDQKKLHIADMGCGKGYLTFALYDYLTNKKQLNTIMEGVEIRSELVQICNQYAEKVGFKNLKFIKNTIQSYENPSINAIIALHACNTATCDAIFKGIKQDVDFIIVAPCCHQQVRKDIIIENADNSLQEIMKYGIFAERHAEILTDLIRIKILNAFGYQCKAIEFISDFHTHKNVMIIAQKHKKHVDKSIIYSEIEALMHQYGLKRHYLLELLPKDYQM